MLGDPGVKLPGIVQLPGIFHQTLSQIQTLITTQHQTLIASEFLSLIHLHHLLPLLFLISLTLLLQAPVTSLMFLQLLPLLCLIYLFLLLQAPVASLILLLLMLLAYSLFLHMLFLSLSLTLLNQQNQVVLRDN